MHMEFGKFTVGPERERVYFPHSNNIWTSTQQKCKIRRVARKALGPSKLATQGVNDRCTENLLENVPEKESWKRSYFRKFGVFVFWPTWCNLLQWFNLDGRRTLRQLSNTDGGLNIHTDKDARTSTKASTWIWHGENGHRQKWKSK